MPKKLLIILLIVVIGGGTMIGGSFVWRYWQTLKQEEEKSEVEVPTDWKTYRNEEYEFEIKYPSEAEWSFKEGDSNSPMSALNFNGSQINFLILSLNRWEGVESVEDFYNKIVVLNTIKTNKISKQDLEVSGYQAIKYVIGEKQPESIIDLTHNTTIAIVKDDFLYRMWCLSDDKVAITLFNQMLSTFKFIK